MAPSLGHWLVVEDVVRPARAIIVLGGGLPSRALEAASTFHRGFASEVWLLQVRDEVDRRALDALGVAVAAEHDYSRRVLVRRGVPESAIRVLPGTNANTADEIRTLARHLSKQGGGTVIIVTSRFHTRRVKLLWGLLAGDMEAPIVRYTPDDPFDADGWWRNTRDAAAVAREYFGMLNAWIGFPVRPAD